MEAQNVNKNAGRKNGTDNFGQYPTRAEGNSWWLLTHSSHASARLLDYVDDSRMRWLGCRRLTLALRISNLPSLRAPLCPKTRSCTPKSPWKFNLDFFFLTPSMNSSVFPFKRLVLNSLEIWCLYTSYSYASPCLAGTRVSWFVISARVIRVHSLLSASPEHCWLILE